MLRTEYHYCTQGLRDEQLDRFVVTETGSCSIIMLADGYSCCTASPHYVDWLVEGLSALESSGLHCENAVEEITLLIAQTECYPGKASVAFVISDEQLYHYSTLGDTRIYWPQKNSRTLDHSVAQLAVLRGECPSEQLRYHPHRNRLMRHAGSGLKHRLEWQTRTLLKNESMILCSDGLWSQLDDSHLYNVSNSEDLARLVQSLDMVPSPDNLSVVKLGSYPVK
jgi:serine/threonine protein phosphatase PrpC